jgi:hypothetical protein
VNKKNTGAEDGVLGRETASGPHLLDAAPPALLLDPADMPSFTDPVFTGIARDVLGYTGGVLVYYEQAMLLFIKAAGRPLAESDHLRKALAKGDTAVLARFRTVFIDGCAAAGIGRAFAGDYWDGPITGAVLHSRLSEVMAEFSAERRAMAGG